MSAVDFYAYVASHCDVLGAGIGAGPDAWEAVVGAGFLDVPGGGLLRRDYGLVEVSFSPDQQGRMSCFGFGVKIHRLLYDQSPGTVPPPLSREYGVFPSRAPFEELRANVTALGHTVELDDKSRDMHRYRVLESGARIHVIVDPDPYGSGDHDPDGHQVGDVWSIDASRAW
ncbi:hypothetical protein OHA79_21080 [Streptomyces sp. NBC_00841]|uniref:hypothetical protein n=1 Tax=unclassified Streptomyces TaxID=2593676 RepID=UPI002255457B|nr:MULTISPECIES: hypothetical protein [unclassified Streptomyces]MCX4534529.1 hypothetical protein [Streptomyces sp. NBC_01669]WSA00121.1 hypothetical protein OHA79_21080 [Streptomyces sp. NBC_00841]